MVLPLAGSGRRIKTVRFINHSEAALLWAALGQGGSFYVSSHPYLSILLHDDTGELLDFGP